MYKIVYRIINKNNISFIQKTRLKINENFKYYNKHNNIFLPKLFYE